jgi:hypothetical protein
MPEKYKPPYLFSTHIGAACTKQLPAWLRWIKRLHA